MYALHQNVYSCERVYDCVQGKGQFQAVHEKETAPRGIKAYVLSESTTGYMHQVCIYYGKETKLLPLLEVPVTARVVLIFTAKTTGRIRALTLL